MSAVVVENPGAQRFVGRLLVVLAQRRVNAQAARVHILGIVLGQRLAHHLRRIFCAERVLSYVTTRAQRGFQGFVVLRRGDIAELAHPSEHVMLALLRALQIDERVVLRRSFGQPCQQGHLA